MKKRKARRWKRLDFITRSTSLSVAMGAIDEGVDLQRLVDSEMPLRRVGILLNQALKLAHQGRVQLDFPERVMAAVKVVEALKP